VFSQRFINLAAAIASIVVFGFALGLMFPLLSLLMERAGVSAEMIGYNTAMAPLGILLAGFIVPRLVRRFGAKMVVIVAAWIAAAIVLSYYFTAIPWWFALRVLHGLAVSTLFSISEAWIVKFSAGAYRTRILALYTSMLALSFGGGPALISYVGIDGIMPFAIGAGVLIAATIPMYLVRETKALEEDPKAALSALAFAPKAPILLLAVGLFAIIDAANLGFLPVYGVKKGMDRETAALVLTAFIVGNTIFQLPIGWLADHYPKRRVMAGCAIVTALTSALIPLAFGSIMLWPVLLVCGAASAGIYTVALSELGERFSGTELVAGTASFATVWGLGAIFGALLGGWAFQSFGPDGLPLSIAAVFALFIGAMIWRQRMQRA
jgi:MFS family permease